MRSLSLLSFAAGCGSVIEPVPIAEALDCGAPAIAGGLANGADLTRVDVDLVAFPDAVCNDGTGAVFFVRPAATMAGRTRWVIELQGGGSCRTPDECAQRWCSVDTNFGMTQMTSTLAPADGIAGDGILYRGTRFANPLADANHVFVHYCSSDGWSGRSGPVALDAHHPVTGAPVRFELQFRGAAILDAVLAMLRRGGGAAPNLDDATDVVLAGASAGGDGVIANVDRIAATLHSHAPAVRVSALIDSAFPPALEELDWTASTSCPAGGCSWQDVLASLTAMYPTQVDESCASWHAANAPATAYLCSDQGHVARHHLATPFFVRQGLRDQLISRTLIEAGVAVPGRGPLTLPLFSELVHDELLALANVPMNAEEHAAITHAPAAFGPPCADHDTLSTNADVYDVTVEVAGTAYTMFDVAANWFANSAPQQVVYTPADPVHCP